MSEPPILRLSDLRIALTRLLDEVEKRHGPEVELSADFYWTIAAPATFTLDTEPALSTGQLTDDLDELATQLSGSQSPAVWHDLEHLIGLLRRLAALDLPD